MRETIELTDDVVDKVAKEWFSSTFSDKLQYEKAFVREYWINYTYNSIELYNDLTDVMNRMEERDG